MLIRKKAGARGLDGSRVSNRKEQIMIRNLKALGLALVAVLAMSAVAASGASAHFEFTSGATTTNTWLTGEATTAQKLAIGTATIECSTATFSHTVLTATTSEVTIDASYSNCKQSTREVHVRMNGCDYLLTGEKTENGGHGKVHIKCPAGVHIEFEITTCNATEACIVTMAEQTATEGVTYVNNPGGNDITVVATATVGVTCEAPGKINEGGGTLCAAIRSVKTGKYTGTTTLKAFNDTEPEGAQVGLTVDEAPNE